MIKKRYLIDQAMTEIGMGGYQFDASPEENTDILRQMDAMVAMWSSKGVDIGYNVPTDPTDSDLDDDSGIELQHAAAVYKSLAVQICPMYGKQPNILLVKTQEDAYNAMLSSVATKPTQQYPERYPLGAGNRRYRRWGF